MAVVRIPDPYQAGVSALAAMPESAFTQLREALSRAPSSFTDQRELTAWISSEVKNVPPADLTRLIRSLASLYRLQSRQPNRSAQQLATEVALAAREIPNFQAKEGVDLAARLAELLVLESLNTTAFKAKELQSESERTFCEARIITDIRPVFGENLDDPPTMMIVQTLKVGFHEPEHKDVFIALDSDDILSLKKTLDRAELKAKKLKSLLDSSGMRSISLS